MGKLQISRVIEGEAEPVGEMQGRRPAVSVGMGIDRDVEQRKIGKGRIAERHIDAAPANSDRQAASDFETPERRDERTIFCNNLKYVTYRVGGLVRVDPRECGRAVEYHAQ